MRGSRTSWRVIAKNEGLTSSRTWSAKRRELIEGLPLTGWYATRRADLLGLLDALDTRIEPLDAAVVAAAEQNAEAQLLMTHHGVGPVVSLAYVLILGTGGGSPAANRWAAIWG